MLYVHEVHTVVGRREHQFEAAFRPAYLPALAEGGDARLLWYLHHAHGTGPAYSVVTVTAVRDATAWEALTGRLTTGDLAGWAAEVDAMRVDVEAKVLVPLPWSPLQEVDLAEVPTEPCHHELSMFMEDTAWPHMGKMEEYLDLAGTKYVDTLRRSEESGRSILRLIAAFRPAWGTGRHREVVLWQRVTRPQALVGLLAYEVPEEHQAPGTWMHDALDVRDRWASRLLRTTSWSPLL